MGTAERLVRLALVCVGILLAAGGAVRLESPALQLASAAVATASLLAALAIGLASLRPGPPGELVRRLGLGPGRLPAWGVALAVLGTIALSHALDIAIHLLRVAEVGVLPQVDQALQTAHGGELWVALFAIAIVAGVGEELFFRGFVQRGLERRLAANPFGWLVALVVAAVLFGALHFDPVHSPAAFVLGLYLGGVARLSDGVRAPIACHVVNNAVAVADSVQVWTLPGPPLALLAGALVLAAAALWGAAASRRPADAAPPDFSPAAGWPTEGP